MKILVATDKPFAAVAVNGIKDVVESAGIELALLEKYGEKSKLLDAVKDVDGLIVRSDIIDAEVLNAAKQLKVVVRAGAGYDNIDLASAGRTTWLGAACAPWSGARSWRMRWRNLVFGWISARVRQKISGRSP